MEARQSLSRVWTPGSLPQASQYPAKTIPATGVMPGSYEKGNVL